MINPGRTEGQKKHEKKRMTGVILFFACLFLGLISLSQYKSLQKTKEQIFIEGKSASDLTSDYITLYAKNQELVRRNRELTANLQDMISARDDETALGDLMQGESDSMAQKAGLLPAAGGGIEVVIRPETTVPITANMLIQFLNEVKAGGATAIAVNGERVVPMTEIRDTYSGYTVNGKSFSYANEIQISAIGNGTDLYNALAMVGGILDKWEDSNIDVHVDIVENLTVPAVDDATRARMDLTEEAVQTTTGESVEGES